MISKIIRCAFQVLMTQEQTSRLATKRKMKAFDNSPVYHSPFSQISEEPKVCSSSESIDDSGADKQVSHQEKNSKIIAFNFNYVHLF